MKKLGQVMLLATVIIFTSCEKESIVDEVGAPLEWVYGKNEYNLIIDGVERNFLIHVPQLYSDEINVPIVMMLHGSTGTGSKFYNISRWVEKSDQEGFIAVFPSALAYKLKDSNKITTKWSSDGLSELVADGTSIKDDIPFIESLVQLCEEAFKIDSKRLYISGFSNGGGFIKTQVITRLADIFAAASVAGGIGHLEEVDHIGDRMIPFHNIAGTLDQNNIAILDPALSEVPIQGAQIQKQQVIWRQILNTLTNLNLSNQFAEEASAPAYNTITFGNGLSGQGNEYELVLIKGLEHNYPNEINNMYEIVAAEILWDWFMRWKLE